MPNTDVRSLSRRFGQVAAVDRISFAVERGEVFGVLVFAGQSARCIVASRPESTCHAGGAGRAAWPLRWTTWIRPVGCVCLPRGGQRGHLRSRDPERDRAFGGVGRLVIGGSRGVELWVLAAITSITGVIGHCPTYALFHGHTRHAPQH